MWPQVRLSILWLAGTDTLPVKAQSADDQCRLTFCENPNLLSKVWAHRGVASSSKWVRGPGAVSHKENSVEALVEAHMRGFAGIEWDCFWDVPTQRIIIAHDENCGQYELLDNGGVLTLEKLLNELERQVPPEAISVAEYWVDFKNLGSLSSSERKNSREYFERIVNGTAFEKPQFLFESTSGSALGEYKDNGFPVSWWLTSTGQIQGNPTWKVWSMGFSSFDGAKAALQGDNNEYELRVFTVNSACQVLAYAEDPRVKVVLTDLSDMMMDKEGKLCAAAPLLNKTAFVGPAPQPTPAPPPTPAAEPVPACSSSTSDARWGYFSYHKFFIFAVFYGTR